MVDFENTPPTPEVGMVLTSFLKRNLSPGGDSNDFYTNRPEDKQGYDTWIGYVRRSSDFVEGKKIALNEEGNAGWYRIIVTNINTTPRASEYHRGGLIWFYNAIPFRKPLIKRKELKTYRKDPTIVTPDEFRDMRKNAKIRNYWKSDDPVIRRDFLHLKDLPREVLEDDIVEMWKRYFEPL